MYRLLRIKNFNYAKIKTLNSFTKEDGISKLCSHCNEVHMRPVLSSKYFHNSSYRQATEAKSAVDHERKVHLTKKIKKPKKGLATRLLGSEHRSKETAKTLITDLEVLEENDSIYLLESFKRKPPYIPKEPNKLLIESIVHNSPRRFVCKDEDGIPISEALFSETQTSNKRVQKKLSAEEKKQAEEAFLKLEIAGRTEAVTKNLLAYLDVCISCGFLDKAFNVLNHYREKCRTNVDRYQKLTSVDIYNVLLAGYASNSNFNQVCEIMDIMKYDNIQPSVLSFVACFECVGRMKPSFQRDLQLKEWLRAMTRLNFTLQSLFENGALHNHQRGFVEEACRRTCTDFTPETVPEVMDYNCALLKDLNPLEVMNSKRLQNVMTAETLLENAESQLQLEEKGSLVIKSVEKSSQPPEVTSHYRKILEEQQAEWKDVARAAFKKNLQRLGNIHHGRYHVITIYPFLTVLPEDQYIDIIMKELRKLAEGSETFSPTLITLFREIGAQVQSKYQVHVKRKKGILNRVSEIYKEYCNWFSDNDVEVTSNTRVAWQQLLEKHGDSHLIHSDIAFWPRSIQIEIGKFLFNIILQDIKINAHVLKHQCPLSHKLPAFYSLYRSCGKNIREEVKPHPVLAKLFRGAAQETLEFPAPLVPMLSPPIPWTTIKSGGHILVNTDIVRFGFSAVSQWEKMEAAPKQQLYPAFDTLNQLGSIPWKINEPMLDVVTQVFVTGGSSELDIPQPPSSLAGPDQLSADMSKDEKIKIYNQRLAVRRQKAEMYSLWCDTLYKLSLANHYRKGVFWLPHNMDFRGRVYPCPPHLNHMSSDMTRSILCFAKGEPLGAKGLDWLKIHVINLTGLKKRESSAKRLEYANEILPDILDSAENPLNGKKWWVKSDNPWQTLAGCMEIAHALKAPSLDEYISYFPIHQDGSCNGLQHYAALGRDSAGAESVNLAPAEFPQDVYSCVVNLVERERARDALKDVHIAKILEGFIKRKVIKQTVMTTVYGVTRFGARLQIARQLKDIDDFPKDLVWQASTYLVVKTFESLREMFSSTKEIQDWLTESARRISQYGQNVEWITPLGLPVVQPYIQDKKKYALNAKKEHGPLTEHFSMDTFGRPNVMKQKNAFPPNFIHSLDSSHMMLTSLKCEQKGITYVSVHDCFWTHPSTVNTMNKICREQFVALHKEPIIENLSESMIKRYCYGDSASQMTSEGMQLYETLSRVPPKGDFDLRNVLDSIYFFS